MSRPFLPLVLLLALASISSSPPATAAAETISHRPLHSSGRRAVAVGEAPSAIGCSPSVAAASRLVVGSCTEDIVRSFFGVRGREICCRALEAVGAGCNRAVFSGSPFADIYATILGNICGIAAAPAPSPGRRMTE